MRPLDPSTLGRPSIDAPARSDEAGTTDDFVRDFTYGTVGIVDSLIGTVNAIANLAVKPLAAALGSDFAFREDHVVSGMMTTDRSALNAAHRARRAMDISSLILPFVGQAAALGRSGTAMRAMTHALAPALPVLPHTTLMRAEVTVASELARVRGVVRVDGPSWTVEAHTVSNWLLQTSSRTCQPTSIVNALLALGGRVDQPQFARVIEHIAQSPSGVSVEHALTLFESAALKVRKLSRERDPAAGALAKLSHSPDELWSMFSGVIRSGEAALIGVRAKVFKGGTGRHATAVTGVAENQQTGRRAVQMVDSEIGVFWLDLEALAGSLEHATIYAIAR